MKRLIGLACLLLLAVAAPARAEVAVTEVRGPESGVTAWLVEDRTAPVVSLALAFTGGAALDPAEKAGRARLLAGTLDEGAGELSSPAFRKALEDDSIELSFSARRDEFSGQLKTLAERRDRAFELLGLALSQPRFDADPVARVKSQILAALERDAEDPQTLAMRRLMAELFKGHPYARPTAGTPETVADLNRDDLLAAARATLVRDRLLVTVVGAITPAELAPLLDVAFADLPETAPQQAPVPDTTPRPPASPEQATVHIAKDLPQAVAAFAQPGIRRDDPDWYAAYVLNYILGGGGFSSRLMQTVRVDNGLAYSVYSYLYPFDHAALWLGGVATSADRIDRSLDLIREEWRKMAENGPTATELADAKTYLTGAWALRFTSTDGIAGLLLAARREGLGEDYVNRRNDFIEAVTLGDLKRLAARHLDADQVLTVVVGPKAQ
ncbi:M16 family metallopeptidase [Roseospirillum parvum]|uniref:Zinc protease n=1 Tax=Roseospirillum parvum TaxID=83401 RepID=A0A1G8EEX0_9PROT|nr:pitrilysin family protein [Roseospirillum parvum]SDH68448.1 zinc protease [Roseospirillum parvum]